MVKPTASETMQATKPGREGVGVREESETCKMWAPPFSVDFLTYAKANDLGLVDGVGVGGEGGEAGGDSEEGGVGALV